VTGTSEEDQFNFTPTAQGVGSFQVTTTGAVVETSPQFTYTGVATAGITLSGHGGYDVLGLTATAGNDTIDAEQPDSTHLNFTLNAFTQAFVLATLGTVRGVNIYGLPEMI